MSSGPANQDDGESVITHFDGGTTKHFKKNEIIVQGSEKPEGVYYIRSGYVKVYYISQLGHQNLLLIHGAHEIMPLPWALGGPQKVGIFYEAMSNVTAHKTSKTYLRQAMSDNSRLTEQILGQLVHVFTVYAQRVQSLGYRLPRERVIACLLDLSGRFGQKLGHDQDTVIKAPVTHQDIADATNMSRETASRALELLFQDELLAQRDHLFIIKDEQKLHAELG